MTELTALLQQLDTALEAKSKTVFDTLQPGADDNELQRLRETCFADSDIPTDLAALYRWHNGQANHVSLAPDSNRIFLSIQKAIEAWSFLNDPQEDIDAPPSPSWIPVLYNGAGDYLMFETRSEGQGKLIGWWHDDEDRDVEYESLEEWVREMLEAIHG